MASVPATQNPVSCPPAISLANGDFEQPALTTNYTQISQSQVPGWKTTATDGLIELWKSGFQGVSSNTGNQFAELNATQASALYQDIPTVPGQTVQWSLAHRGRQSTTVPDVMAVKIGAPGGPLSVQASPSDTKSAWGLYSGLYTIPAGQTVTRFQFEAISSAGGDKSIGNFLDSIQFGNPACVVASKTVTNLSGHSPAQVGDVLQYSVSANNAGGLNAPQTVLSDAIPAGTTYQPGSLSITSGPGTGALTDATGDDRGEYQAAGNKIVVRLGDGATASKGGSLAPGASSTATFRVVVTTAAANNSVQNVATVDYRDTMNGVNKTATSQTTDTPVGPAADVQVVKTLVTQTLVAGSPVQYSVVVTNNGPQPATDVTASDNVPSAITGASARIDGGSSCPLNGSTLNCAIGTLAVGASATITVNGTLAASTAPGSTVTNTATVSANEFDFVPANNTSSVSTVMLNPQLGIIKSAGAVQDANGSGRVDAGDTQLYTFLVTNTGTTVMNSVTVNDPKIGTVSCPSASLTVGASMTCTGSYTLTQADLNTGSVTNTATATGTPPGGTPVTSPPSQITTPLPQTSTFTFAKGAAAPVDSNASGHIDAGDTIGYTFTFTNTGNTTLSAPGVTDAVVGAVSCPNVPLAPGATVTCTAGYTITQADMDAGKRDNSATGTVTVPGGGTSTSTPSTTSTPLASASSVTVQPPSAVEPQDALASTGVADLWLGWLASGLIGAGALLLAAGWRRRMAFATMSNR